MPKLVVFLDDGGVMNDNLHRGAQWQQLVGAFFVPILGGTPAVWAEANRTVTEALFEPAAWQSRMEAASDYRSFEREYLLDWLGGMCVAVGVARPPDATCVDLTRRAGEWITQRVNAAFPGVIETIRLTAGPSLRSSRFCKTPPRPSYLEYLQNRPDR